MQALACTILLTTRGTVSSLFAAMILSQYTHQGMLIREHLNDCSNDVNAWMGNVKVHPVQREKTINSIISGAHQQLSNCCLLLPTIIVRTLR